MFIIFIMCVSDPLDQDRFSQGGTFIEFYSYFSHQSSTRNLTEVKRSCLKEGVLKLKISRQKSYKKFVLNLVCGSYDDDDDDDDDHEEEFYWTEIEVNVTTTVEPPSESVSPPNLNPSRPRIIPPSGRPIQTPAPQVTTSTSSSPLSNMQFFSPSKSVHVGNSSPLTLTLIINATSLLPYSQAHGHELQATFQVLIEEGKSVPLALQKQVQVAVKETEKVVSVVKCTEWNRRTNGALSANGKRLARDSGNKNNTNSEP
ncbi:hypothetical protein Anas_07106 [Armadillidium nasatum]|uniref:Uncharacterized protein n=1 Tax=Armadillidium nasatum TaxID=96803 RepID=A0A5N5SXY8_9CRUS|nr:hypothetical protein Anas_07106 [Armadillidium nasatum]